MDAAAWDTLPATERYLLITMIPVESSNLESIGYYDGLEILAVAFKSGAVHHYRAVPPALFREFEDSLSKGQFYSMNVRGKFTSEKLTGECPRCGSKPGVIGAKCYDCGCAEYAGDCGAEGPDGLRCSKVKGHDQSEDEDEAFHGRGRKTWKQINGAH